VHDCADQTTAVPDKRRAATARTRTRGSTVQPPTATSRDVAPEQREHTSKGADCLKCWLELPRDPYELYRTASNEIRRELSQAIFKCIWAMDQDRAKSELAEPVRLLIEARGALADYSASEPTPTQTRTTPKRP
jgi:hypothetical protein